MASFVCTVKVWKICKFAKFLRRDKERLAKLFATVVLGATSSTRCKQNGLERAKLCRLARRCESALVAVVLAASVAILTALDRYGNVARDA